MVVQSHKINEFEKIFLIKGRKKNNVGRNGKSRVKMNSLYTDFAVINSLNSEGYCLDLAKFV
jgi:hypothetical protein